MAAPWIKITVGLEESKVIPPVPAQTVLLFMEKFIPTFSVTLLVPDPNHSLDHRRLPVLWTVLLVLRPHQML